MNRRLAIKAFRRTGSLNMISIRRAVAVVQFAGLRLLSDGLLRLSDEVDAEEDDEGGEELGRALD